MNLLLPYGTSSVIAEVVECQEEDLLLSNLEKYHSKVSEENLVIDALLHPIGSPCLSTLAKEKDNIVIIASDHTRPVPSKLLLPKLLEEIHTGNPGAKVTILIATGCHRGTTRSELESKFGKQIVETVDIVIHNCDDSPLVKIGTLPSGGECYINKLAVNADLLISEGFIEPHFFAGFSGGRKSVLPGIAGRSTVLANHCSEFIHCLYARTGNLHNNPMHIDMLWAARKANLAFILNVVLNEKKEVIYAVSGDMEKAHEKGCEFVESLCKVEARPSDIVITTNGGYPLDQNIYQAVKGMTAAEATVKKGGVIIMLASCDDGHGGEAFYRQLSKEKDITKTLALFLSRDRNHTQPDQWQSQVFIRVLLHATVIFVSRASEEIVKGLHMIPASNLTEAMSLAKDIVKTTYPRVTVIPDGVSVIVK